MNQNLGTASFQYGSEDPLDFDIAAGESIGAAWRKVAADLGANAERPVTFRAGGVLVSSDSLPTPGQTIVATVTHEQKG